MTGRAPVARDAANAAVATFAALAAIVVAPLTASCRRAPSPATSNRADADVVTAAAPPATVVVLDGGARPAGEGSWSCEEGAARGLPSEPVVGSLALGASAGSAPIFTFASAEGGRRHRAWELAGAARAFEGPPVSGDVPPWVPAFSGGSLLFARIELAGPARVVVGGAEDRAPLFELPIAIGDELAVDAAGSGSVLVVAASSSRGVEIRSGAGAKADATALVADAYAPAVLVGGDGTIAVAARVDAPLEAAKPTRAIPAPADLEGAGQERMGSSLVVVSTSGQRLATQPLPAGSEVLGTTPTRDAIVFAATRVVRGARTLEVDAVRADGKRERLGAFPVRRAARLYPVSGPPGAVARAVLEVVDEGAALLGDRAGALPVREVEALFGARLAGDSLDFWLLRGSDGGRALAPVRCAWRAP